MSNLLEEGFGKKFPVSDTIRNDILDARTISRSSLWWTAVLQFRKSETEPEEKYITLYKWKMTKGVWKRASSFKINSSKHLEKIVGALQDFHES